MQFTVDEGAQAQEETGDKMVEHALADKRQQSDRRQDDRREGQRRQGERRQVVIETVDGDDRSDNERRQSAERREEQRRSGQSRRAD